MGFSAPHIPSVEMPPPAAHPALFGSSAVQAVAAATRQRAAVAEGKGSDDTVKTSPQGEAAPTTAKATLLGQ